MADRFGAWKERKDEERKRNAMDAGGGRSGGFGCGGGGGGGRGCHQVIEEVRNGNIPSRWTLFFCMCLSKCGEMGHFARECPSGGGGGRSGGRGGGGARRSYGGSGGGSGPKRGGFGRDFF